MPDEPIDVRTLRITKPDAAALYEALTLLSMFESKNRKMPLPYNARSITDLQARVLDRWPELRDTYVVPDRRSRGGVY